MPSSVSRGACAARVEIVLQDHRRRRRIEERLALAPVLLAARQQALRFAAAEPLVLEDDRHTDQQCAARPRSPQPPRSARSLCRSAAGDIRMRSPTSPSWLSQRVSSPLPPAPRQLARDRRRVDRLPRPREQAGRVRQRETDASSAIVDSERAHRESVHQQRCYNPGHHAQRDHLSPRSSRSRLWWPPSRSRRRPSSAADGRPAVRAAPRHPRFRRDGSGARRPVDARRKAAEPQAACGPGRHVPARDDAFARIADRVGVVCDRREPRQAQHLRLSRARHDDVSARSRHGASRAGAVPVRLHSLLEAEAVFDSRRHLVLGHRREGRGPIERAHGSGHVSAGNRPERRNAVRPAAPGHSRDDGHLLLLCDRSEPI